MKQLIVVRKNELAEAKFWGDCAVVMTDNEERVKKWLLGDGLGDVYSFAVTQYKGWYDAWQFIRNWYGMLGIEVVNIYNTDIVIDPDCQYAKFHEAVEK